MFTLSLSSLMAPRNPSFEVSEAISSARIARNSSSFLYLANKKSFMTNWSLIMGSSDPAFNLLNLKFDNFLFRQSEAINSGVLLNPPHLIRVRIYHVTPPNPGLVNQSSTSTSISPPIGYIEIFRHDPSATFFD